MLTSIEYSQRLGFKDQILVVIPISMKLNNQNNENKAVIPFFSLRSIFFQRFLEIICSIKMYVDLEKSNKNGIFFKISLKILDS